MSSWCRAFLYDWKAASWSGPQTNADLIWVSCLRGSAICAPSGIKWNSWFAVPRKPLNFVTFVGKGNYLMARRRSSVGCLPRHETTKPAKVTFLPMYSFLRDRVMFLSRQACRTLSVRSKSSSKVDLHTRMSSISFSTPGVRRLPHPTFYTTRHPMQKDPLVLGGIRTLPAHVWR